jgi:hypothetical protein
MYVVVSKKHGTVSRGGSMSGDKGEAKVFEDKEEAERDAAVLNRDFPGLDATVEEQNGKE